MWVNNPTADEIGLALAQGAAGCTTNPAHCGGLLRRAPEEVGPVVAKAVQEMPYASECEVVEVVQRALVERIVDRFRPVFDATGGRDGFVSIQGAPASDTDGESIWRTAQMGRAIGPNAVPKIPATLPGFVAFERVVESGWPVIVTEVFSLDQLEDGVRAVRGGHGKSRRTAAVLRLAYNGHLGNHLKKLARQEGLDVNQHEFELAGVTWRVRAPPWSRQGYPVRSLFGGAQDYGGFDGACRRQAQRHDQMEHFQRSHFSRSTTGAHDRPGAGRRNCGAATPRSRMFGKPGNSGASP